MLDALTIFRRRKEEYEERVRERSSQLEQNNEKWLFVSDFNFANFFRDELLNEKLSKIPPRHKARLRERGIINLYCDAKSSLTDYGRDLLQKERVEIPDELRLEPIPFQTLKQVKEELLRHDKAPTLKPKTIRIKHFEIKKQRERERERETQKWRDEYAWKHLASALRSLFKIDEQIVVLRQKVPTVRVHLSEEHKRKISDALKGRPSTSKPWTEERKARFIAHVSHPHKKFSEEGKRHVSESRKGKPLSAEHRLHLTKAWREAHEQTVG